MKNGMVSIIVPVYNAAKFIDETIKSVINQSYDNWELLLIDDGSQDNSVQIIEKYTRENKIILLQHPNGVNLGVSKTRELGIKYAKGEFISFLDADDVFYTNKLSNQLKIFSELKDIILVHSKVEIINNTELKFDYEFAFDNKDKEYKLDEQVNWLVDNRICNSTVIVKSIILKNIQFGLPQLFQFEDWLLWSLIAQKGNFYYQNSPQIKYRIHSASATNSILKNELITPYSKIEFLISYYLLNKNNKASLLILKKIKEEINNLVRIYSNGNSIKIEEFKKEFNELNSFKSLSFYKFLKKIKNYLKKIL